MRTPRAAFTGGELPSKQADRTPPGPGSAGASAACAAPALAEAELLARIRAGDPGAFEELFIAHYEGMCALAYMFVRSRDAAEDIASNVFRSLWMRRLEWEPTGPPRSYLLSATRNEAINLLRRLRRERGLEDRALGEDLAPALGAPAASPDTAVMTRELADAIERASAQLPPRCREVFFLRWREGLKQREIAERLGIALKTVEMQTTRALKAIREQLHEHR